MDEMLEPRYLMKEFDVTYGTLARWRCDGTGPPFIKVGKKILYPRSALEEWLKNKLQRNTHDKEANNKC